jgi:hypothetical protein
MSMSMNPAAVSMSLSEARLLAQLGRVLAAGPDCVFSEDWDRSVQSVSGVTQQSRIHLFDWCKLRCSGIAASGGARRGGTSQ